LSAWAGDPLDGPFFCSLVPPSARLSCSPKVRATTTFQGELSRSSLKF